MIKITDWTKNVAKSTIYATADVLGENFSTFKTFTNTNQDLFKDAYSAVKDYRSTFKRVKNYIVNSDIYVGAGLAVNNMIEDLKTGNFYNPEREERLTQQYGGDLLNDENWNFDDMDFDWEDKSVSDGEKIIASAIKKNSKIGSAVISETIATSAKGIIDSGHENMTLLYLQNERILGNLNKSFESLREFTFKHAETQDKIREKHNENTVKFYKKIEDNTNKIVAELDELVKLQRRVIYGENEKNKNEKHNTITDINNDGAVDLKEYGKIVKKQLFDQINNMAGGVFSMSDSLAGANIFAQIAQNPMKDLLQSGIKAVIRPEFKKISGDLDESMKGWFSTLISRLNNEKKSENPFYKFLGNVFGLKVNKESDSVDTGKYKKGAISFDGVTKKAITYVIPYYLRKMTSILTGEDEMVFNYNTGKFTTVKSVHSQYKNWKENPWQNSSLNTMIREVMGGDDSKLFRSHNQQERYNKDKQKFLEAFAKQNADPNDILHDPYSYGVSEEFAELMRKYIFGRSNDVIDDKEYYYTTKTVTGKNGRQRKRINGIDRTKGNNGVRTGLNLNVAKMGLASNLYEIYNNRANFMKDIENDPTNIMRILFSEGINNEKFNGFKDKHGDYDQTRAFNSPLAKAMMIMKDEYDYSLFDYLRNIKKDLSAIRANGDINAVLLGNQPVSSARVDDSNLMKFEKLTDTSNKYENIKKDHRYRMFNYSSIEERINKRKKEEDYEKMMTDRYNRYQENSKRSTKPEFYAESYDDLGLYIQSNIKYMENQEIDRYNEKNKNLPNFYKNLYEFGLIDENTAKKYNKIKYESGTSFKDQMGKLQSTGEKFALIRDYAIKLVEKPMIAAEDAMISVNKWVEDIFFGDAGKKDNENDDNKKDRSLFGIIKTRFKEGFEDMGKIISDKFTEIMDSGPIAKLKKEVLIPVKEFFIGKQPDSQADREGGILSPLLNGLRHSVDDFIERNKDLLKTDVKKIKNAVTSNNNDNNENENNNTSNTSITRENYIQSGVSDDVIKRIEENNSKYNNLDIDDDNGLFKAFVSIIWKNPTMLILLGAKLDNNQKITNTKEVINEIHNYLNWGSFKKYKMSELLYESRCQEYNNSSIVKFMKNNKGKDIFKNDLNVLNSTSMRKFNELESIVKNKNIDIEKYKLTNKDILKHNSVYRRVLESDHNIMMNLKEHNLSIDDYLVWASNKYKDNIWSIIMPSTVSEFIIANNEYDYKKFIRSSNDIRNKFKSNTDSNDKMIDYLINRYKTGRKSLDELPQEVIDIINGTDTDDNTETQTQATNNNTAILGRIVNPLEKISENLQSLVDKFNNIPLFNNNQNNPPQMAKGGVNLSGKPFKSVVSSGEIINGNIVPPGGPYITTIPDNGIVINPNSDENIKKQAKQEKDFLKNIKMNAEPGSLKSGLNAVSDWIGNGKNTQTVTDSVVHGGAGFGLGFLLGHPLIGATIGAASSLKNKSNGLANLLFGDAIKLDEDGNVVERSDSGLISKEIINSVPSLRLGGALGAIAGLLTPIGPIGGILVGSALGFANKNHELEQALFGAGGLDKKKLKEVLPSMGVGAAIAPFLLAGLGSPLGFVGNALVGSVAGYITTTESFKDVIMGEEDENGNRHGGIVGTLKAASEPLKNFGQTMVEASLKAVNGLFNSFVNQVINPIAKSVSPIVQEVKNKVNDTFTFLNDKLSKIGLGKQNILDFAGNVGSGIGKTAIGLGKAALWLKATPLMLGARGIQALGSHLQRKQIRRGKAYNMSAQERLDARSGKGKGILGTLANGLAWGTGDVIESGEQGLMQGVGRLFGKKLKPGFIADRYKQNDEILASMSANMSSDELQELAGALRYDPNEDDGKNIENQLDPLRTSLNDELKDTTKGIKNNYKIANKINDLVFSNRPQDAIDYINENDQLSDSQKKKMIRKVKSYSSQSNTIRNKFAATKNAYMNLDKKAKELGLDVDLSDKKQRDQLAKNIETEIKRKNNGLSEDELAKQAEWKNPDNPEYQQVNLLKEIILSLKEIGKPESERKNEITKSDEDYEREAKYRLGDQTSDFYKNMQRKAYDRIDEMDSNGRFKNEDEKNKFIEKNLDTLTQKYATESLKNKDKRLVNSGKFINNKTQYQYEEKVNKAFNSETPDGLVKGSYKYADQELEKLMKNMTFESDKEKEDYIKLNRNKIAKRHAIDSLRESDEQAINVKNESYDNIERINKKLSTLNEIGSRSDSYYNDRSLEYRFTDKEKNKINTKAYKDLEKEQERRTQEKKKELEEILKNKYLNDEEKERYINSANINPTEKEVLLKKYRNQRAKEFRKEYAKNLKRNDQKYLADNIMNTNNIQDNFLSGYQEFDKTYGSRNNQFGNAAIVGGMSLGTLGLLLGNPLLGAKIGTVLGGAVGGSWDTIRKNPITNRYTKGKVKKRNAQAIDVVEDIQSPKDEYGFASGNYLDGTEIHTNAEADDNLTPLENTDDTNTKLGIISKIKSKFSKSGKKNKEVGDKDKKDKSNSIFKKFGSVLKETVGDNLSKTYDLLKDKLGQKVQEVKEHPIKKIIKFLSSVAGVPLVIGLLHKTVFPFIKDKVAPVFLGKKNADGDYEGGIISGIVNPIKNKINEKFGGVKDWVTNQGEYSDPQTGLKGMASKIGKSLFDTWIDGVDTIANTIVPTICEKVLPVVIPAIAKGIIIALPAIAKGLGKAVVEGVKTIFGKGETSKEDSQSDYNLSSSINSSNNSVSYIDNINDSNVHSGGITSSGDEVFYSNDDVNEENALRRDENGNYYDASELMEQSNPDLVNNNAYQDMKTNYKNGTATDTKSTLIGRGAKSVLREAVGATQYGVVRRGMGTVIAGSGKTISKLPKFKLIGKGVEGFGNTLRADDIISNASSKIKTKNRSKKIYKELINNSENAIKNKSEKKIAKDLAREEAEKQIAEETAQRIATKNSKIANSFLGKTYKTVSEKIAESGLYKGAESALGKVANLKSTASTKLVNTLKKNKITGGAVEGLSKAKKWIQGIPKAISEALSKLFKSEKFLNIISKFSKNPDELIKKLTKSAEGLGSKAGKELAQKGAEETAEAAAKATAKGVAGVINIAFVIADFVTGMADARNILQITNSEIGVPEKIIAGISKVISGYVFIISESTIAKWTLESIGQLLFKDKANEILQDQKDSEEALKAYNEEHNTELTLEEYNNEYNANWYTKAKSTVTNAFKSAGDSIKSFVTGEDKKNNKSSNQSNTNIPTNASANDNLTPINNQQYFYNMYSSMLNNPVDDTLNNLGDNISTTYKRLSQLNNNTNKRIDDGSLTPDSTEYWNIKVDNTGNPFANAMYKMKESFNRLIKSPFSMVANSMGDISGIMSTSSNYSNTTNNTGGDQSNSSKGFTSSNSSLNKTTSASATSSSKKSSGIFSNIAKGIGSVFGKLFGKGKFGKGIGDHIYQRDYHSSYQTNGDTEVQTVADSGCGPAAAAAVMNQYGLNGNMNNAVNYALKGGFKEINGGTYPEYFNSYLSNYGIQTQNLDNNNDVVNSLINGQPVVMMGQDQSNSGKTPYGSDYSHYVVATGLDDNGNVIVEDSEDPNGSTVYSLKDTLNNTSIKIGTGYRRGKYGKGSDNNVLSNYTKSVANAIYTPYINYMNNLCQSINIDNDNSSNQQDTNNNNSTNITNTTSSSTTQTGTTVSGATPTDKEGRKRMIWNMFIQAGFSPNLTAGILGNMQGECSTFDPNMIEGGSTGTCDLKDNKGYVRDGYSGYGICQFTGAGGRAALYNWCHKSGLDPDSLDGQVKYIIATIVGTNLDNAVDSSDPGHFGNDGSGTMSYNNRLFRTGYKGSAGGDLNTLNALSIDEACKTFFFCFERPRSDSGLYKRQGYAHNIYNELAGGTGKLGRAKSKLKFGRATDTNGGGFDRNTTDTNGGGFDRNSGTFTSKEDYIENNTTETATDNTQDTTNTNASSSTKQSTNVSENGISYGGISDLLKGYNNALYGYVTSSSSSTSDSSNTSSSNASTNTTYNGSGNVTEGDFNTNRASCWRYLRANGFSKEATAGCIGTFVQETGLDNKNIHATSSGKKNGGLIGWTPFTKHSKWCSSNGFNDPESLESQLAHVISLIDRNGWNNTDYVGVNGAQKVSNGSEYKSLNSIENAVWAFERNIVICENDWRTNKDADRISHAKKAYDALSATDGSGTGRGYIDATRIKQAKKLKQKLNDQHIQGINSDGDDRIASGIGKKFGRASNENIINNETQSTSIDNQSDITTDTDTGNTNSISSSTVKQAVNVGESGISYGGISDALNGYNAALYGYLTTVSQDSTSGTTGSNSTTYTGSISESGLNIQDKFLSSNRSNTKRATTKAIVVHYVGNPNSSAIGNWNYFETGATKVSANFIIGLDGEILRCMPEDEIAYCSNTVNDTTISIENCHLGKSEGYKFNDKTYASLVKLCAYLCLKYGLDPLNGGIMRHYDVICPAHPKGKCCPPWFIPCNATTDNGTGTNGGGTDDENNTNYKTFLNNIANAMKNSSSGTGRGKFKIHKPKFGRHAKESPETNNYEAISSSNKSSQQISSNTSTTNNTELNNANTSSATTSSNTTTVGDSASLMSKLGSYIGNSVKETYGAYYYTIFGDEGASNSSSSSSGTTSTGTVSSSSSGAVSGNASISNTIAAAMQVFYLLGPVDYSHDNDKYKITLNGKEIKVRPDCSGCMSAVIYAMGYSIVDSSGKQTHAIFARDFASSGCASKYIRNADGSATTDWEDMEYSPDKVQPGDIVAYSLHTEMYWYTDSNGKFRGFSGGSGKGCSYSPTNSITKSYESAKAYIENKTVKNEVEIGKNTQVRILRYKGNSTGGIPSATTTGKGKGIIKKLLNNKRYKFGGHAKESNTNDTPNNQFVDTSNNPLISQSSGNNNSAQQTPQSLNSILNSSSSNTTTVGDSASLMSKLGSYIGNSVKETYGAYYYVLFGDEGAESSSSGVTSASTTSSGTSTITGTSNTIIAGLQVFQAVGEVPYSQGTTTTITVNGNTFSVRHDCSGYMTAVVRALGYKLGGDDGGLRSGDFATAGIASKIKNADGSDSSDWVDLPYDASILQPGDIIACHGHTEMYWFTNSSGSFRMIAAGSDEGIRDGFNDGTILATTGSVKTAKGHGFCNDPYERILRYKGNVNVPLPDSADLSKTNSTSGNVTTTDSTSTSTDSTSTTAGTGRGKNNIKHKQDIINSNKNNFINTYSIRNRSNTPKTYKMQNMQSKGINYINDENYNSSNRYGRASINNGIQYEYSQQPNIIQNTNNNINYAEVLGSLVTAVQNIADNSNKTDKIIELLIAIVTNTNTKDNKKSNDAITNILRNIQNSNKNSAPITSLNQVLNSDNSNIGTAVYNIAKS